MVEKNLFSFRTAAQVPRKRKADEVPCGDRPVVKRARLVSPSFPAAWPRELNERIADHLLQVGSFRDVVTFAQASATTRSLALGAAERAILSHTRREIRRAADCAFAHDEGSLPEASCALGQARRLLDRVRCPPYTLAQWGEQRASQGDCMAPDFARALQKVRKERLAQLDAPSFRLRSLLPEIGRFTSLVSIDLSSNLLTDLPKSFAQLSAMQCVDLSNNRLASLPSAVRRLSRLSVLDVSDNYIHALRLESNDLSQLRVLRAQGNRLSLFPQIESAGKIEELQIGDNPLCFLPRDLSSFTSLESLGLDCCGLFALPQSIGQLWQLRTLNIEQNELRDVPQSLFEIATLEDLFIYGNPLREGALRWLAHASLVNLYIDLSQQKAVNRLPHYTSIRFMDTRSHDVIQPPVPLIEAHLRAWYPKALAGNALATSQRI